MPMLRLQERSKLQLLAPVKSSRELSKCKATSILFVNDKDEKALTVTKPRSSKGLRRATMCKLPDTYPPTIPPLR